MKDSVDSGVHMLKMLFCVILIAVIYITALPGLKINRRQTICA